AEFRRGGAGARSKAAGVPRTQGWDEPLARFRASGQPHLAICPSQWLGVATAVRTMFGQVLHVPELPEPAAVSRYADVLLESGARKIVLGGFARGYDGLVQELKHLRPTLPTYVAGYGHPAHQDQHSSPCALNTL